MQAISLRKDGKVLTIATIDNEKTEKKRILQILKVYVQDEEVEAEEGFKVVSL